MALTALPVTSDHPYRGRVTLLELTREMYQHDLEHLWQTRRMIEALTSPAH